MASTEKPARGSVTSDPELRAMIVVLRTLRPLSADAQRRVLAYLRDKYDVPDDPAVIATIPDPQGKLLD